MENYKLATQQKLRFATNKGLLSVEQLWDLSITDLDELAVSLENEYKQSAKKSFLVKSSTKDKTTKLRFDIVLDVLTTKVETEEVIASEHERKQHNAKILELISEKKDDELKGKSIKELEKMLK